MDKMIVNRTAGQHDALVNDTLIRNTHMKSKSADTMKSAVSFNALTNALIAVAPTVFLRRAHFVHDVNPTRNRPPLPLLSFSTYPIARARARALCVQNALWNTLKMTQCLARIFKNN